MALIAIRIISSSGEILATYMQDPEDEHVWTWFDGEGIDTFTKRQKAELSFIASSGSATSMCQDSGSYGHYVRQFKWFDGRLFNDIRVKAVFI